MVLQFERLNVYPSNVIGGAPYENYLNAFETLSKRKYNQLFTFRKIGLLYYDDDEIRPGTYFCYKILDIA